MNGITDTTTSSVVKLAYVNGKIWYVQGEGGDDMKESNNTQAVLQFKLFLILLFSICIHSYTRQQITVGRWWNKVLPSDTWVYMGTQGPF